MRKIGAAAWLRPAAALTSFALLAMAYIAPIWVSKLDAPQYPKGLWLLVWRDHLSGNVNEINGLNHYIGMRSVSPDVVPELQLWWLALVSAALLAIGGLYLHGALGVVARIALWAVPVTVVIDIQRWLYAFGHDLSSDAALRMKPFTPLAIGPTKVWNFEILALPGPGLAALFVVALLVTLVPRATGRRAAGRLVAGIAALLLIGSQLASCAPASAPGAPADEHEHAPAPLDLAAAVAAVPDGGTLHVPAGRYPRLVIARPITLIAHGDAVLDGGGTGTVLEIRGPNVTVEGFVVERSGGQVEDAAAILVTGPRVTVANNVIRDSYVGILARGTRDLRIVGNTILGPGGAVLASDSLEASHHDARTAVGDGIWLHDTESTLVRGNSVRGMRDGIYLSYARETLVDENRIEGLRYGVHAMYGSDLMIFGNEIMRNASGLVLMNTRDAEASRNVITDSRSEATGYGVLAKDTVGLRLAENVVARGRVGIRAEGADRAAARAEAIANRVSDNAVGVQLFPTARLVFSRNAFVDNLIDVDTPGAVTPNGSVWVKSGAGNYWSGYAGYDLDGDRLGDLPHVAGSSAQRLLVSSPDLRILRTSIAYAVLARAERWWDVGQAPKIVDPVPLMTPIAPQAPAPRRDPADALVWAGAAVLLVLLPAASALATRR